MKQSFILLLSIILFQISFAQPVSVFVGKPKINDPSVVGNHPNTPFLFAVPTSGERPMVWSAKNLPAGLKINTATGFITGNIKNKGVYKATVLANNKLGSFKKILTIKIGDTLALTPPMGWNSWNTCAENLNDSLVRQVADSMATNGMRDLGYQYINLDDFWQLPERDRNGNIQMLPSQNARHAPHRSRRAR